MLIANFNLLIVNKVLKMIHLSRIMNDASFRVSGSLMHCDDNFTYGSFRNPSCYCNRHVVILVVINYYNVNSKIRICTWNMEVLI